MESSIAMNIRQKPSPNFYDLKRTPEIIVLHTTLGAYEGAIEWLRKPGNSSAHFVISRFGEITQLVQLDKGAWHAGRVSNPSPRANKVLSKTIWGTTENPNKYSIGVEFASGYDIDRDGILESWEQAYSPQQIKAAVQLHLWIEQQLGVTIDRGHVLTHRDIASYKPDLEKQRAMYLAELEKQRNIDPVPAPPTDQEDVITLEFGEKYVFYMDADDNLTLQKAKE